MTPSESLLIFSDVHLGSDLNDSGPFVRRSVEVDRDLASLIAHYRGVTPPADRWRIIIAGDFIDFVGMSIDPTPHETLATELTTEEIRNGVGSAEDHACLKLQRVGRRHPEIFKELGAFVAAGHSLTVLHGNHDVELHWDAVKDAFRALVVESLPEAERDRASERIDFQAWFFYRKGVVYIEHGHQYDPFCSTSFILAPLSPRDPRRVERGFSETLLRAIVRRTPGMREHGHEERGLTSYVGWGLGLGLRGAGALFWRFGVTVAELVRHQRAYFGSRVEAIRAEHERRLAALAESSSLEMDRLRRLVALQSRPIAATLRGVLASLMLDRLAVFSVVVVALLTIAVLANFGPLAGHGVHATLVVLALWAIAHVLLSRGRGSVDPAQQMQIRARELSTLFPAPFVIMGHTHLPLSVAVGDATYINVGSWAEEEPEEGLDPTKAYRAARTHAVIHEREGKTEAHLFSWHPENGPMRHPACRGQSSRLMPSATAPVT